MYNTNVLNEKELILYFDAYTAKMNVLSERRFAMRAKSADPESFDARFHVCMARFEEAVFYLDVVDLVYLDNLVNVAQGFLDSEQLS